MLYVHFYNKGGGGGGGGGKGVILCLKHLNVTGNLQIGYIWTLMK